MSKTKKSSSGSKGSSTTKKSTTSTAEINQVKQQLNTVKSSLQLESSSLAPMEGTLNTLKELKTRLETAIDTLRNQKDGIEDKYTLDSGWRGDLYNASISASSALKTEYGNVCTNLGYDLDALCDEITRRENEIYNKNEYIGKLQSSWNSLCNWLEKHTD